MSVSIRGGLLGFIARLGRPMAADSDADLLDRFVLTKDEAAFSGIVHRHGPMVLAVCRRRLGRDADAEDSFQAVFLALSRSASSIGRRESLPGWLYRVAYLVSLKAAGRRARHPMVTLPASEAPMPDPPMAAIEVDELKAVLDAEVARLPDKFRAVVVLCLIEGRTNAEAAADLGVPIGTIDSRLHSARTRLQARLSRRGVAVGTGIGLGQLLGGPLGAADCSGFRELALHTVRVVLAEATGAGAGAISPAVVELAQGVTMIATTKLRLLAAIAVALGLLGGAGAGVYFATAAANPAGPMATSAETKQDKGIPEKAPTAAPRGVEKEKAALDKPFGAKLGGEGVPMNELLERIEEMTDLVVRVDVAAFRRIGAFPEIGAVDELGQADTSKLLERIYSTKAIFPRKVEKLPIRDVLADALAQIRFTQPCTYRVQGSQLVIVPAYVPPLAPGVNPLDPANPGGSDEQAPLLSTRILNEQIYGPVVSVAADRMPLDEVLADLRKQTGANIVLDPRCANQQQEKKATVTVSLNDVRLYDTLRVIADMAELKMVYAGNIYYVTTAANAKTFQPAVIRQQGMGGVIITPPPQP